MEISDIRMRMVRKPGTGKLRAFCSVTIDSAFVVRDLKVIEGSNGGYFVAMPSRLLTDRCPRCGCKNHLRAKFCNGCGARLAEDRADKDYLGRLKLHEDTAHPLNTSCRDEIQREVLEAFHRKMDKLKQPEYTEAPELSAGGDVLDEIEEQLELPEEKEPASTEEEPGDTFGKGLF